jgi:hypothetical protein
MQADPQPIGKTQLPVDQGVGALGHILATESYPHFRPLTHPSGPRW